MQLAANKKEQWNADSTALTTLVSLLLVALTLQFLYAPTLLPEFILNRPQCNQSELTLDYATKRLRTTDTANHRGFGLMPPPGNSNVCEFTRTDP
jgi:hypothetical protein